MAEFESWYAVARPRLHPALTVWCGDADAASDALDEAFVRAVERWPRVAVMASPEGWVWRTATNHVRRTAKRRARELAVLASDPGVLSAKGLDSPVDPDLRRAILGLSPRQRTAVVLHYLADLSTAEVASVMGVAVGTVHATLHQARARLAGDLSQPVVLDPAGTSDVAVPDTRPTRPPSGGGAR